MDTNLQTAHPTPLIFDDDGRQDVNISTTDSVFSTLNASISQIYAFGDSYSDNGQSFEISTNAVNADVPDSFILPADPALRLYDIDGRWTNGPTVVEVLSENLDVDLTDYAVGGAKSGNGNYYSWLDSFQNTGVSGQIEQFSAELSGKSADPDALYFIFASANDLFEYTDFGLPGTVQELAAQTVENIVEGVSDLSALGAEQFLVVNSSDLDILPGIIEFEQVEEAALFTDEVNRLLPQALTALDRQPDIDVDVYDHVAISDDIRSNPQNYGLSNVDDPCQPVFPVEPVCSAPDEYYFWDEYHPTRRVHQIIGEDIANFIDFEDENDIIGTAEDNTLFGTNAADVISGLAGKDIIYGKDGEDSIFGGTDNDTLVGGKGTDDLMGDEGHDVLLGGQGADALEGGEGNDALFGNGGDDTLRGGSGEDLNDGGHGNDTADFSDISFVVRVDLSKGEAVYEVAPMVTVMDTLVSIENLIGSDFDDSLWGDLNNNILEGGGGNDRLLGFKGRDILTGGKGDDTLRGGKGADYLDGGSGNDALSGGKNADTLNGGVGSDVLFGRRGADTFEFGSDLLDGLEDIDTIQHFQGQDSFSFSSYLGAGGTLETTRIAKGFLQIDLSGEDIVNVFGRESALNNAESQLTDLLAPSV